MKSKYKYHIDLIADQKLAGHLEFLAQVSETAALHVYEEYKRAINFIEDNAFGCPKYNAVKLSDVELRSCLFAKRYRIIFEIIGFDVFAYDIQDCRQNPDNNLV